MATENKPVAVAADNVTVPPVTVDVTVDGCEVTPPEMVIPQILIASPTFDDCSELVSFE